MRIRVLDDEKPQSDPSVHGPGLRDDDLQDAAEIGELEPTKSYHPVHGEIDESDENDDNDDSEAAPSGDDDEAENYQSYPSFNLSLDLNLGKLIGVGILFIIMFALPVGIVGGVFNVNNFRRQPVYTATAINAASEQNQQAQENSNRPGQVAGVSDQVGAVNADNSNSVAGMNILGVPAAILMVLVGLIFISLPVYAVLRL